MRTVKVVVIGASGVGKTSLRNQYISERFTTGYRATIGADFITKTVPHYNTPDELVTLQIWDTAGQERFSSLASAFFRGADVALLMFDVNQPDTLQALTKWWSEFREKAPVPDEEVDNFCCVFVGNKIDVHSGKDNNDNIITEQEALRFIHELIPPASTSSSRLPEFELTPPTAIDEHTGWPDTQTELRTDSIDINPRSRRRLSGSRSRSWSTMSRGGITGTMTTTHTVYHTPASSLFDTFESALSSPIRSSHSVASSRSPSHSPSPARPRQRSSSPSSISSVPTITPSLFIRAHSATESTTPVSAPSPSTSSAIPPKPERGAKLFFTSAKTGEGVTDVFEYVARRVVMKAEYDEAVDARTLHIRHADDTIRLTSSHLNARWPQTSCCGP